MLNKKRIILFIAIFIASIIFFSNISFAVTGKITAKAAVRIREKASVESEIITNVYNSDIVEVIEKNGDWYKVKYEGKTGYINKNYISVDDSELSDETIENSADQSEENQEQNSEENSEENQPEDANQNSDNNANSENDNNENVSKYENKKIEKVEGKEITLTKEVKIKLIPNYTSKTLGKIDSGTNVTVKNQLNYWVYVTNKSVSGWINVRDIVEKDNTQTPQEPTTEPEENNSSVDGKTGKVNVKNANVREKPTTSSEIIAGLKENDEVTIIDEDGEWYKIKTSKIKEGYISKKLITIATMTSRGGDIQRQENSSISEAIDNTSEEIIDEEILDEEIQEEVQDDIVVTGNTTGEEVANFAIQFLGYDYVYAGKSPDTGFDCSGFTQYVFSQFGVSISASSVAQINYGEEVSEDEVEPGDLLIFLNDAQTKIGHVGIYIGNDEFVHAANPKRGVVTDSIYSSYYRSTFSCN